MRKKFYPRKLQLTLVREGLLLRIYNHFSVVAWLHNYLQTWHKYYLKPKVNSNSHPGLVFFGGNYDFLAIFYSGITAVAIVSSALQA